MTYPLWQSDWQEEFLKIFDNIKNLIPSVLKKGFQKNTSCNISVPMQTVINGY